MRKIRIDFAIFIAFIGLGLVWTIVSSISRQSLADRPVPTPSPVVARRTYTPAKTPPEVLLAALDDRAGNAPAYGRLLDATDAKCTESRDMIGDMTVQVVKVAKEGGVRTSNFDMLNGLNNAIQGSAVQECAPVYAEIVLTAENSR